MPTASHPDDLLLLDAKVADQLYMYSQNLPMRALPPAEKDFPEGDEAAVLVETSTQDQNPELMTP